jgi:serine/threonine protein kinase
MAIFGKYQFVKKLATGGMAEVWLARQTGIEGFNRHVVIKKILPHLAEDPEFVQMFLNEARVASRLTHANIAQIYELGQIEGQYYIALEFVHGEDLGRLMRKAWSTGQWIARPLAIRMVASACEGLHYAHTRVDENGRALKVVHRDISPQNILVSFDGSVKVVDFGIAKAADQESMTKSGAIKGKFAYMAPEQAAGKPLDARTDIFAIGLVLYELLTGVGPLNRESELATLQAALECAIDPPSVVAEVPSELDGVVMRALAKAPDDR